MKIPTPEEIFNEKNYSKTENPTSPQKGENYSGTETLPSMHTFEDISNMVQQYLPNTKNALKLLLAVATAGTRKNRTMLWLLLVGSPSSGKTDLVRLIKNSENVISLDNLTLNAFISGERPTAKQKVYDLLPKLNTKCLAIKDWTTIFSLDERATKKILGDLVSAYDKTLSKHSSRRGHITYDAEFSHLGCITPATLNRHSTYLNMVGPRFLHYTMPSLSREEEEESFKAIFSNRDRAKLEKKLREIVSEFLDGLNKTETNFEPIEEKHFPFFKIASRFTAMARGIVVIQASSFKNEAGENITYYEPLDFQIEQPWRAVQQLITLAQYLAFVSGRKQITEQDLEIIKEVVLSSMPASRSQALRALVKSEDKELTAKQLSKTTEKSHKTALRLLEELTMLGVVQKTKGTGTMGNRYRLEKEFEDFVCIHSSDFVSAYSDKPNSSRASLGKKKEKTDYEAAKEVFQNGELSNQELKEKRANLEFKLKHLEGTPLYPERLQELEAVLVELKERGINV